MLIPITQTAELKANGVYNSTRTLRTWHHTGRYAEMFVKEFGRIFVDTEAYKAILEKARTK